MSLFLNTGEQACSQKAAGSHCAALNGSQLYGEVRLCKVKKRDKRIWFFDGIIEQINQTYCKVCITLELRGPINLRCFDSLNFSPNA